MKIEENRLLLDEPLADEAVEEVMHKLDGVEAVVIRQRDLGGAVIQALLCATREKKVTVEADSAMLRAVFANPIIQ